MSFTITRLAGQTALVTGPDPDNKCILDTRQFDDLKASEAFELAGDAYDAEIKKFFAPLIEAEEKIDAALKDQLPKQDPAFYIVTQEAVEGVEAKPRLVTQLETDTVILRMIESGDTSRLLWMGDQILITEAV